jgi:hypothetical protein
MRFAPEGVAGMARSLFDHLRPDGQSTEEVVQ